MGMKLNHNDAKKYGKRGMVAAQRIKATWHIEGETVTMKQIAERIGMSIDCARDRHNALRKRPGAITWAAMRGEAA